MRLLYRVVKTPKEARRVKGEYEYPELKLRSAASEKKGEKDEESGKPEPSDEEKQLSVLGESLVKAEKILEAARKEAELIKNNAYEEGYTNGKQDGYSTGFESGMEEGVEEGRQGYLQKKQELEELVKSYIEDVQLEKDKILESYMDDLKEIALSIGEKIVKTSLRSDSRVVERMIIAATGKLRKSAWAKIYVGSMGEKGTDVKADPRFLQELEHLSDNVKIVMMDGVEPGTCIVERPDEIIDVSVGTQLENIREIMNNARL